MTGVVVLLLAGVAFVALSARGRPRTCTPGTVQVGDRTVRYLQRMLGGASESDDVPVLVFFHARGTTPEAYEKYVERLSVPARAILPAGPVGGRSWFAARAADADQAKLAEQMTWTGDLVTDFLVKLRECIPGRRVDAVSGFSQGASMAFMLASRGLAPAVGISGWLPARLWSAAMLPTVAIHGFTDDTVPYAPTALWAAEMVAQGAPMELVGVAGGHSPTAEMLTLWRSSVEQLLAAATS